MANHLSGDAWAFGTRYRPQRRRRLPLVAAMTAFLMAFAGIALADNVVADGDGLTPIANSPVAFGNVSCGVAMNASALLAIQASGRPASPTATTFGNGVEVTITVQSVTGVGLSASVPASPGNEITLAGNWTSVANNILSDSITSTVTINSSTPGSGSGSVTYRASGLNNATTPATITRDVTMNVSWNTGSCAPADTTPPALTVTPPTPDGQNGWFVTQPVSVAVNASDDSGVASINCTPAFTETASTATSKAGTVSVTAEGITTVSCTATDSASPPNTTDPAVTAEVKIDTVLPSVSLDGGPADGASYPFGSVPAVPSCSASDPTPGSGLAAPCEVSGYGTSLGTHTVMASASDNAGNQNSASATYTVDPWSGTGFYSPVGEMNSVFVPAPDGLPVPTATTVWNVAKGGSTVPLKFNVYARNDEKTSDSDITGFTAKKFTCPGASVGSEDFVDFATSGNTVLRYDSTEGQFIQNWKTPKVSSDTCYRASVEFLDGSSISAFFKLRK